MLVALPGRKKYFSTQRLVPQNFLPTKNEMIKQGKLTLAADWEVLVKSQESFSKKKWIVSSDDTWHHMIVSKQHQIFNLVRRVGSLPSPLLETFFIGYDLGLDISYP